MKTNDNYRMFLFYSEEMAILREAITAYCEMRQWNTRLCDSTSDCGNYERCWSKTNTAERLRDKLSSDPTEEEKAWFYSINNFVISQLEEMREVLEDPGDYCEEIPQDEYEDLPFYDPAYKFFHDPADKMTEREAELAKEREQEEMRQRIYSAFCRPANR